MIKSNKIYINNVVKFSILQLTAQQQACQYIYSFQRFKMFRLSNQILTQQQKNAQNKILYLKQFIYVTQVKQIRYLYNNAYIDKNFIKSLLQRQQDTGTLRLQTIHIIYNKCIKDCPIQDNGLSFNALLLIQYLLSISNQAFINEFNVVNEEHIEQFIKCLTWYNVKSLIELRYKAKICKHLKYSHMRIEFTDTFTLEQVDDNIINQLLSCIEERLQRIYSNNRFMIIRNISIGKISKIQIMETNEEIITQFLQSEDQLTYDVIMNNVEYSGNINKRIRYLNYFDYEPQQLFFKYPLSLLGASLQCVQIRNLSECKSLKAFSSDFNSYTKQDIQLQSLQYYYSNGDQYNGERNSSILSSLFKTSKQLHYVHINGGQNVSGDAYLRENIGKLRYLYIDIASQLKIVFDSICFYDEQILKYTQNNNEVLSQQLELISEKCKLIKSVINYEQKARYNHIKQIFDNYLAKNSISYYILYKITQKSYTKTYCDQAFNQKLKINQEMTQFLQNYISFNKEKTSLILIKSYPQQLQNYKQLKYYIKQINTNQSNSISQLLVLQLYNEYLSNKQYDDYKTIQFNIFLFIKYILQQSNELICKKFDLNSSNDVKKYLEMLKNQFSLIEKNIQHNYHFPISSKASTNKTSHLIYEIICNVFQMNHIQLLYVEKNDIKSNFMKLVFVTASEKLQFITIPFKGIVVHDVNAQEIIFQEQQCVKSHKQQFLQSTFNKNQKQEILLDKTKLYDIIVNEYKDHNIENNQIRCLFYLNKTIQQYELTLLYPNCLITATLVKTTISNLNRCEHLTNIYSEQNHYTSRNITSLRQIKRFFSNNDTYTGQNCMVDELFATNKLHFVQIVDGCNIISPFQLKTNIKYLTFFYICSKALIKNVKMIIEDETPLNLLVFHMTSPGRIPGRYITRTLEIAGDSETVKRITAQLL